MNYCMYNNNATCNCLDSLFVSNELKIILLGIRFVTNLSKQIKTKFQRKCLNLIPSLDAVYNSDSGILNANDKIFIPLQYLYCE